MKTILHSVSIGIIAGLVLFRCGMAQTNQKLAQTSMQFLTVTSDARVAAMADAVTGLQTGSSAMFFNPSGMSSMENSFDIAISRTEWIADIKHYTAGFAVSPANGDYGVFGLSMQYVDYGEFIGTVVDLNSPKQYQDVSIFHLNAMAVGLGYAKRLTDQFSVGAHIQWVRQDLGQSYIPNPAPVHYDSAQGKYIDTAVYASNNLTPLVFSFGTQFRTGIKSLVFGMSVRNFSKDMQYVYESFQLPLVFTIGVSMNLFDLAPKLPLDQVLNASIDASHYRDHPEQLKIGLEYKVMNLLAVRGGYASNVDEASGWSFGVGVAQAGFAFDYAYTPYGAFDKVQRITVRFTN